MKNLKLKQIRFCQEYLVDGNATQAAIRAGYSENTAQEQGSRLLSNVMVSDHIERLEQERSERTQITADRVLSELARLGFVDVREFFTDGGALVDIRSLPKEIGCAIQSFEVVTRNETDEDGNPIVERLHKIKLVDKKSVLELLAKNLKLLDNRTVIEGSIDHKHTVVSEETQSVLDELTGRGERPGDQVPSTH